MADVESMPDCRHKLSPESIQHRAKIDVSNMQF